MQVNSYLSCRLIQNAFICLVLLLIPTIYSAGQNLDSERFNFVLHDSLDHGDVAHLAVALEENYERIKRNLQVATLPLIRVQIWADNEAYQDAMEDAFGMRFPGSRGYVYGADELRILFHNEDSAARELVHEFVHAVSLTLNPEFGNNPRWLWEAVAQYEAGEFRDPREISYVQEGNYPGLDELNAGFNSGRNIYDIGFVLVDYIVKMWGKEALIALIRSNGAIQETLNINVIDFESGWHHYMKKTYFSNND